MKKPPKTVESMRAAAAIIGVPLAELKTAKADGCPAFKASNRIHLPTLEAWLKTHAKPAAPTQPALPPLTADQLEELGTLEASRTAAIRDEIETGRLLQRARESADSGAVPDLTLAVGRARKNRLALEVAITKLQVQRKQLLDLDTYQMQLHRLYTPFVTAFRQIPRKAAAALHPDLDAVRVEKVVSEIVEAAIGEARGIVAPSSADEKRWAARQLLMVICGEGGRLNAASLENVDSLRAFVVSELARGKGEVPAKVEIQADATQGLKADF